MTDNFKAHLISFAHTFVASFLTTLGTAILLIPQDTWSSPSTWTTSFVVSLVLSALRTAVKMASEKWIQ